MPTMRAYTGAVASRRSRIRSSASPSSGAKISTEMSAAGTTGTSCPVLSWKKKYAVTNATAPCAKLKMPDVWYVSTRPAAMIE